MFYGLPYVTDPVTHPSFQVRPPAALQHLRVLATASVGAPQPAWRS